MIEMFVKTATTRRTTATLTSTSEVKTQTRERVKIHRGKRAAWMTVAKILAPADQQAVHVSNDHRSGLETLTTRSEFAKLRADSTHRLAAWSHMQVTIAVPKHTTFVPKRKTKEVQSFTAQLTKAYDLGLLAVDRQAKAAFQRRFDPPPESVALIIGEHHESSAYRTSSALAQWAGPSLR